MNSGNRRGDGRVQTRFESLYASGRKEGTGVLTDISYSGAHVEGATCQPELGKSVRLYVFIQPVAPFELVGEVVRRTETGFAIAFSALTDELKRFVDDVGAVVNVPQG